MTKKIILGLLILVVVIGIVIGIIFILNNKPDNNLISLEDKYYGEYHVEEIDHTRFNELEKSKENFVVYVTLVGCSSCEAFKPIADEFLKTNKLYVYHIEFKEMQQTSISNYVLYTPSMIIFQDGEKLAYLDAASDDDLPAYKTVQGLTDWFKTYIKLK